MEARANIQKTFLVTTLVIASLAVALVLPGHAAADEAGGKGPPNPDTATSELRASLLEGAYEDNPLPPPDWRKSASDSELAEYDRLAASVEPDEEKFAENIPRYDELQARVDALGSASVEADPLNEEMYEIEDEYTAFEARDTSKYIRMVEIEQAALASGSSSPDNGSSEPAPSASSGDPVVSSTDSGGGFNPFPLLIIVAVAVGGAAVYARHRGMEMPTAFRRAREAMRPVPPQAAGAGETQDSGPPSMEGWTDSVERPRGIFDADGDETSPAGDSRRIRRKTDPPEDVSGVPVPPRPVDAVPVPPPGSAPVHAPPVTPPRATPTPRPAAHLPNSTHVAPRAAKEMSDRERETLRRLPELLKARVIGQDHAADALGEAVQVQRVGFGGERPVSVMLCGTTGVGKTELAKSLASALYGSEDAYVRLDMSEYQDKISASRMIGAAPGYIGHDEGGQLTGPLLEDPRRVVLFDEIEKADPKVLDFLLQVLDDGRLTDSQGRTASFGEAIVILTSNLGSEEIREYYEERGIDADPPDERTMKELLRREKMRPELVARMGEIVTFRPLRLEDVQKIATLLLQKTVLRSAEKLKVKLSFSQEAIEWVAEKGFEPENGARPLRGAILRHVERPLSKAVLAKELTPGMEARFLVSDDFSSLRLQTKVNPRNELPKRPSAAGSRVNP